MPNTTTLMNRGAISSAAGARNFCDGFEPRGRFADRTKRLTRRQESDVFRHYIMPLTWIAGLVGFLGMLVAAMSGDRESVTYVGIWTVFAPLFAAPALTALVRLARGHFHSAVREGV